MFDAPSQHFPDRIEIELHTDPENIAKTTGFSIPLYQAGQSVWRQGMDSAGGIDVAAIEIDRSALPETAVFRSFTPLHLIASHDTVEIGTAVLILGSRLLPGTAPEPSGNRNISAAAVCKNRVRVIVKHLQWRVRVLSG